MSIKINKNNKEYDLGFVPEHYPADRVYLDGDTSKTVQDAIERGSVSVTADGVKTIRQLLNSLHALVNTVKITANSKLRVVSGSLTEYYYLFQIYGSSLYFTNGYAWDTTSEARNKTVKIDSTGSKTYFTTFLGNASADTDTIISSGNTYTILY